MKCILTGGGTRGHVYPALAIADLLSARTPETNFVYIGVRGKAEEELLKTRDDIRFAGISAAPLPSRAVSGQWFTFLFSLLRGIRQSFTLLRQEHPQLVIGTGGYVAVPVFLAAKILGIPTCIHEQNVQPGIANRLLGRMATRIGVSFEDSLPQFPREKTKVVGYPIRSRIRLISKSEAREQLGFPQDIPVLFFFGGSQGARSINELVVSLMPRILNETTIGIIHGTGTYESSYYRAYDDTLTALQQQGIEGSIPGRYQVQPYFDNIEIAYSAADLIVGRAGAGTVLEIAQLGLAAVLVPKWSQRGQHQLRNAEMLRQTGGAEILQEAPVPGDQDGRCLVDPDAAFQQLTSLVQNSAQLFAMRTASKTLPMPAPDAIVDLLLETQGRTASAAQTQAAAEAANTPDKPALGRETAKKLDSPRWPVRNAGVKLAGLHQLEDCLPTLLAYLTDRTPASFLDRLFGGDFRQVGFIRRNAATTVGQIHIWNEDVRRALLTALTDPYWEVRTAALKALAAFADTSPQGMAAVMPAIMDRLQHDNFEVVATGIRTWCALNPTVDLHFLQTLYCHPNRLVRSAILDGLDILHQREMIDENTLHYEQSKIFIPGYKRWKGKAQDS